MLPSLMGEMARLRHEELLRGAEQVRRGRSVLGRREAGAGRWHRVKAAVGTRMVAAGSRLLEAGLQNTR